MKITVDVTQARRRFSTAVAVTAICAAICLVVFSFFFAGTFFASS